MLCFGPGRATCLRMWKACLPSLPSPFESGPNEFVDWRRSILPLEGGGRAATGLARQDNASRGCSDELSLIADRGRGVLRRSRPRRSLTRCHKMLSETACSPTREAPCIRSLKPCEPSTKFFTVRGQFFSCEGGAFASYGPLSVRPPALKVKDTIPKPPR